MVKHTGLVVTVIVELGKFLDYGNSRVRILPIDNSEGPLTQAPACSQQAVENLLGDPF
uniref:Uncharacterized protein n=1 Tax=Romanomermis culicivorax TaxID=13658 RepID=A0A915JNF1_ROMCU